MRVALFICVVIFPTLLKHDHRDQLIVWNVGQGQFVTAVTQDFCFHFDMGGEKFYWSKIRELCSQKQNLAYFSHWDWDHISFTKQAAKHFPNFCVAAIPGGQPKNSARLKIFEPLKRCSDSSHSVRELKFQVGHSASSNENSRVFVFGDFILIPGDSGGREEKSWSRHLKSKIKLLLLGHHGSRTSTSRALASRLPHLEMAIATARRARYGHPHREVTRRVQNLGASVLKTEDWGNIRIELSDIP